MNRTSKRAILLLMCIMTKFYVYADTIVTVGYLQYSLSGAYASVYGVAEGVEEIIIPSSITYDGITYVVSSIGESAFATSGYRARGNNTVKKVVVPSSVKTIGFAAFYYSNIEEVILSEGVVSIYSCAFCGTNLREIIIPSSVNCIQNIDYEYGGVTRSIFYGCNLLRTIIYLNANPPNQGEWTATSRTYVPNISNYYLRTCLKINEAQVVQMISFSETYFTYTGYAPVPTWTNNVEGYSVEFNIPELESDVGSYKILIPATFSNGSTTFTVEIPYQYTISPVQLKAKVNDARRYYGDSNPDFTISYSGFVNGEDENTFLTQPSVYTTADISSSPGTYPITPLGGESKNYTFVYENGTLTIDKAQLTIKADDATREYGGNNPSFTYTLEGLKNGETQPTWTDYPYLYSDAIPRSTIGTYDININGATSPNYEVTKVKGTLSVTKAPLTVQVKNVSRLYGENNPTFSHSVTGKKFSDDDLGWVEDVTYSTPATNISDCGEYEVYPEGQISNSNYDLIKKPGKITIQKKDLIVSTPNYKRPYGTDNPTFEMNYDGFVLEDNQDDLTIRPTIKTTASKDSNVGVYPLSLSGGESKNYNFVDQCGTLTIEKAEQTLSWEQEFGSLAKYDQVELQAQASSGLDVKYTIVEGGSFANIYKTGSKSYLDILGKGDIVVMAQQDGNQNYYSTAKIYKTIHAVDNRNLTLTIKDGEKGELIETISHGESRQILIQPYRGYKIHSVTFNNQDVTTKVSSEGLYNTPSITDNSTLHIVFEAISDAIQNVSSDSLVRILANNGVIVVENLEEGKQIIIYDLDGRKLASAISNGYSTTIRLATDQTYIVKAGTKTVKVRL